jgi:hypothetical protein
MTQITVGEVAWEDASTGGNQQSDFMRLSEGDNKGRVLSNPQQYAIHWVVDETGQNRKVNCAVHECPVCLRGQDTDRPTARWMIKFLNRKEGRVQLLEIGSQVLQGIKELVKSSDWGPVTEYDINIRRGPKNAKPLYTVMPLRHSPLTNDEKQSLVDFNERVDILRFVTPPTPEVVAEKLGWDSSTASAKSVDNSFKSSTTGSTKKSAIDFDF